MTHEQASAWAIGAGNLDPSLLKLLILSGLYAALFLWGTWALVHAYKGWTKKTIDADALGTFVIRLVLLLTLSLFFFAS